MDNESKKLAALIQSVADGNAVDWQALDQASTDDELRRLLEQLRVIEGVANVHRSQIDVAERSPRPGAEPPGVTVGMLWGQFLLVDKLGEGAYGEVYHARDTLLERAVALKLLKPSRVDRSRFLHEARTLVKVRHDNVVGVHGADVHGGRAGFWMDLIQGQTLADVVAREGPRSAGEAAIMGQDLCRALAAVHATGIVHRDVKAQNVMRESGGRLVLMDFGAGELIQPASQPVPRAGTPLYLAPELFGGAAATVQADIYALGVLLFFLVTGTYPVRGHSVEELEAAHARGARQHLGDLRPDLSDAFVRVVETALSPSPERRFPTAGSMRSALEGVVVSVPPSPAPHSNAGDGVLVRIPTWVSRAILAVLIVTGFGLVSTAAFNLTFRRSGFGAESILDWFVWGARSLVAPAVYSLQTILIVVVILALGRLFCRLVPAAGSACSRASAAIGAFARRRKVDDPNLLLEVTTAAGAVGLGLLAWTHWPQVSAFAMFIDSAPAEHLAALQPDNEHLFDSYGRILEQLLLLYGFAVYGVYRIARRSSMPLSRTARTAAWALPIVALLVLREVPYRTVYQNRFERVDLEGARCYQIGTRPGEILLHCPDEAPPRNLVVSESDPRLRPTGIVESVFTPRRQSQ